MARILSAFFSVVLMAASAGASTITWGPATNTTGPSDVSLAGVLVKAVNMAGNAVTVNGVAFQNGNQGGDESPFNGLGHNFDFAGGADLGDPDFTELRAISEPGSLLLVGSGVALLAQRRRGTPKA